MVISIINTSVGSLRLMAHAGFLVMCDWEMYSAERKYVMNRIKSFIQGSSDCESSHYVIENAKLQLEEYFNGKRQGFDIPVKAIGTAFQNIVWDQLEAIPYGESISYSELAKRVGNPRAVRAVASACRANALSLFIPCHRVTGKDGKISGYAGGAPTKQFLIRLERSNRIKSDLSD